MNRRRRVTAALLAGLVFAPMTNASAGWTCAYYKWSADTQTWYRMATAADQDQYEATHDYPTEWNCHYCYIPAVTSQGEEMVETVQDALAPVVAPVSDALAPVSDALKSVQVWPGPACPRVPPEPAEEPPVP